jgi:hypothetical protein
MNLPSDTPRLPKWIFFLGYAALLVTAWLVWDNAAHPTTGLALVAVVGCVALASVIVVIPFVTDYANRQDEALDNRQRSLQALAVTVAAASEQVSIAATGLQGIAEAAQENFSKSERLSKMIQEKIAELDGRLSGAKKDDGEVVARYEAAAKKISKAAAEFEAAVAKAGEAARAVPAVPRHVPEMPPVIASRIVEIRPAALPSIAPFETPAPAAPVAIPEPEPAAPSPAAEPAAGPAAEASPAPEASPGRAEASAPAPVPPRPRLPRPPPTWFSSRRRPTSPSPRPPSRKSPSPRFPRTAPRAS